MRKLFFIALIITSGLLFGCQSEENASQIDDLTGNEVTYALHSASEYDISGSVVFQEKTDNSIQIIVKLLNTDEGAIHPVHIHFGPLSEADSTVAQLLVPVNGTTGRSVTRLKFLADETSFTYADLLKFNGSLKIHLDDGLNRGIVLAAGNIGINNELDTEVEACDGEKGG